MLDFEDVVDMLAVILAEMENVGVDDGGFVGLRDGDTDVETVVDRVASDVNDSVTS